MTTFEWEVCAADMLDTLEVWSRGGGADKAKMDKLVLASSFAARAFERAASGITADGAPVELLRAFLTALIDPLQPSLDCLRQNPDSGEPARAARQEARHD